jgi:hypothetical protein
MDGSERGSQTAPGERHGAPVPSDRLLGSTTTQHTTTTRRIAGTDTLSRGYEIRRWHTQCSSEA